MGDGATVCSFSDRTPATVVAVTLADDGRPELVTVQLDRATLLNGPTSGETDALKVTPGGFAGHVSGVQRWRFERDEDGTVLRFSWRKSAGRFILVGERSRQGATWLDVSGRSAHYDFNF